MKTIYTTDGKITVDDKTLSLAREAAHAVYELSRKNNWRPSIEIDVPYSANGNGNHSDYYVPSSIMISFDTGITGNEHTKVRRALAGKTPTGNITTDLGDYGHEGWDSYIDDKDLFSIPDIYFQHMVIHDISSFCSYSIFLEDIEKQHWKDLAPLVCKQAEVEFQHAQTWNFTPEMKKKIVEYTQKLITAARGFSEKTKVLKVCFLL